MIPEKEYHKYVFDTNNRKFIGHFEEMYQNEDGGNYDSWFQEDMTHLGKQISLTLLNRYNFISILDIGCGKGTFTHLLKKVNTQVVGTDISENAILKARSKYRDVDFFKLTASESLNLQKRWDLIILSEVLSYIENWGELLENVAEQVNYIYISLYIPPNPIGYVKNFNELKTEVTKHFDIETELLWNNETMFILAKRKNENI